MSISFPKTWVSGERLNAEDVRNNLDAMQSKQQELSASDIELASPWVDTHHIMQGRYDAIQNLAVNVSGVFGGRYNGAIQQNLSYCSRWISNRQGFTVDPPRVFITYTNITFDILRPCTLFFQWSMVHQSVRDNDGVDGETIIRTSLNNKAVTGSSVPHVVAEQPNGSTHNVLIDGTQTTNGIVLTDVSGAVHGYNIGLSFTSTAGQTQNVSWAVSLECFYM